jgi:hypothetical protein
MSRSKEYRFGEFWFYFGFSKRFGLGFSIDKFSINVDFICFWAALELPAFDKK